MAKNPKWKELLLQSLSQSMEEDKNSINYCLSTVSRMEPETSNGTAHYQPESRTVVHRGFVNERRKPDDPSSNPSDVGSSEALLVCTDLRSPKIDQLVNRHSSTEQIGPLTSICWWLAPTGEQFRIRARAYVIPPILNSSNFPRVPKEVKDRISPTDSFDWEQERIRVFDKLSPELKTTFLGPSSWTPGNKLIDPHLKQTRAQTIQDNHPDTANPKSEALNNFALIVLDPVYVDLVRLKTSPHQRFSWKKSSNDDWEETELIP